MSSAPLADAERLLREACGERVRRSFPMAPLTTFRIGGPAALYLEPESADDLAAVGNAIAVTGVPFVVVGKGSNVLVSDAGFPGIVLRLGRSYRWAARDGDRLTAGGSMPLPALAGVALHHGLAGLEFGVAIPATLGGAIKMNAGAHDGSISDVLERLEVFHLMRGSVASISGQEAGFSYRRSALPHDGVVIGGTLRLHAAGQAVIRRKMDEAREWRRRTQPLAEPNCGSVFTNPPDDHAARLIEAAGGKGRRIGGASVSTKHANFIVAEPGATATDVATLIAELRALVEREAGVRLVPEVRFVGEFAGVA